MKELQNLKKYYFDQKKSREETMDHVFTIVNSITKLLPQFIEIGQLYIDLVKNQEGLEESADEEERELQEQADTDRKVKTVEQVQQKQIMIQQLTVNNQLGVNKVSMKKESSISQQVESKNSLSPLSPVISSPPSSDSLS
mmetsp:Transcript_9206/g.8599  ORF Transcript_9206/g.8599 Transcript_9206/m.8599 type:complete len:140 (+) Transcript_9206:2386-2805(+)